MASSRSVPVCTWLLCLLLVFVSKYALASTGGSGAPAFTCDQVRELFEGNFGSPDSLHSQPHYETEASLCRRKQAGSHFTCCSQDTEESLAAVAEKRLKKNVRTQNHALKKHITNILARYQDRLAQLVKEAQNRTSVSLSRLHKVPVAEQEAVVSHFFTGLQATLHSGALDGALDDLVRDFFTNLFPAVFNFVLTDQGQEARPAISQEYHACLKRYADQIQPFGNQADQLLKHLRRSMKHALVFQDALKTFTEAMTSTEGISMDSNCRHALVRLQVCPGCRGVSVKGAEVKPCRGMCLNVMRGCLAKISEISSSWDELVVSFENLQVGMMGQHELQRMLMYMDMNVSEAIMMAMDDSARIYDEVKVKCQNIPREDPNAPASPALPPLPDVSQAIPARSAEVLASFQQEVKSLVRYLEDSRGMLNRLADNLCQREEEYSQDMQSATCWNGTAVGRYMEQVPEANFMSQVQRNKEVKVHLMDPDFKFLQVKESLTHMRRNLSSLLNADIMLGDGPPKMPYKNVASTEGSGHMYNRPEVVIDDEDLVAYGSGSGSGSGDGSEEDKTSVTQGPTGTQPPTRRPPPPKGSGQRTTTSFLLLCLCLLCHRLWDAFK